MLLILILTLTLTLILILILDIDFDYICVSPVHSLVLLFLFLVALGAPFLAGGRGGWGVFMTPSVGFFIGFPVGAFVAGWIMRATGRMNVLLASALAAAVGGILVVYAFGIPGVAIMADLPLGKAAIASAVYIPGDLIKVAVTAVVTQTIARGLPGALLSRA